MDGLELAAWRHKRNLTQTQLAAALECNPRTVARWERGLHRLPMAIAARLVMVDKVLSIPPPDPPPTIVGADVRHHWPQYDLYTRIVGLQRGPAWGYGPEHPHRLLGVAAPVPADVMTSTEYLAAVAHWRATGQKPAPSAAGNGAMVDAVKSAEAMQEPADGAQPAFPELATLPRRRASTS
jgi:transcriptional regulator with XRE-family HTH domain